MFCSISPSLSLSLTLDCLLVHRSVLARLSVMKLQHHRHSLSPTSRLSVKTTDGPAANIDFSLLLMSDYNKFDLLVIMASASYEYSFLVTVNG